MLRCALTRVHGCQLVVAIVVLHTDSGALLSAGGGQCCVARARSGLCCATWGSVALRSLGSVALRSLGQC